MITKKKAAARFGSRWEMPEWTELPGTFTTLIYFKASPIKDGKLPVQLRRDKKIKYLHLDPDPETAMRNLIIEAAKWDLELTALAIDKADLSDVKS